jgi:hypothetical protein
VWPPVVTEMFSCVRGLNYLDICCYGKASTSQGLWRGVHSVEDWKKFWWEWVIQPLGRRTGKPSKGNRIGGGSFLEASMSRLGSVAIRLVQAAEALRFLKHISVMAGGSFFRWTREEGVLFLRSSALKRQPNYLSVFGDGSTDGETKTGLFIVMSNLTIK